MVFTTMGYWKEAKKVLTEFVKIFNVFHEKLGGSIYAWLINDN